MVRLAFLALIASIVVPGITAAATFQNPLVFQVIRDVLEAFVVGVIYVGTPAFGAFIVWTGFLFVAAQGSHEGLRKAKEMAKYVLIGGFLLLASWLLVQIVGDTLAGLSAASLLVIVGAFLLYVLYKKR